MDFLNELSSMVKRLQNKSIDLGQEIVEPTEEAEDKGYNVGEAIYTQSVFFADHGRLINPKMQDRIKEFQFCKSFSCSPYPSLQETPVDIIDDFFIIEEEFNLCIAKQQQEKKDA